MDRQNLKYIASGGLAGVVNGLLGAGGGMALVPLLISWCKTDEKKALATSVAIVFPLCVVSAAVYFFKGNGLHSDTLWYLAGGLAGGTAGGLLMRSVPPAWLLKAFGALMLVAGAKMAFW